MLPEGLRYFTTFEGHPLCSFLYQHIPKIQGYKWIRGKHQTEVEHLLQKKKPYLTFAYLLPIPLSDIWQNHDDKVTDALWLFRVTLR